MKQESNARTYVVAALTIIVSIASKLSPQVAEVVQQNFEEITLLAIGLIGWYMRSAILKVQAEPIRLEGLRRWK